jgi:histidinol-phosphate/aromatic aminotransferase/cobyric acid decarboxylase-like protein
VATFYGVTPAQVAITHGLDDAVDQMIQSFPDMRFSIFEPTFLCLQAAAAIEQGALPDSPAR